VLVPVSELAWMALAATSLKVSVEVAAPPAPPAPPAGMLP
jgi:hypothetical protein